MGWRYTNSESIALKVRKFSYETLLSVKDHVRLLSPEEQKEYFDNVQYYFYDRPSLLSLGLSSCQYYHPNNEAILRIQAAAYFATLRWRVFNRSRSKSSQLEGIAV